MLPLSLCRLWQPDRAANAAQDPAPTPRPGARSFWRVQSGCGEITHLGRYTRPITEACATREAATSSVTSPRSFSARFHGLLRIHVCRDAIPLQGAIGTQRINLGSVEVPGRWHATHYFLPGM